MPWWWWGGSSSSDEVAWTLVVGTAAWVGVLSVQAAAVRRRPSDRDDDDDDDERESRRRWQHAATGQAFVGISYVLPVGPCVVLLLLGAAAVWCVHTTPWYRAAFGAVLRPDELRTRPPGALDFLLGTAAVAVLCDLRTTRYALLCLSYADPLAAAVGRRYPGSPRLPFSRCGNKSCVGSAACGATAFVLGCLLWYDGDDDRTMIAKAVVGAVACTLAEATADRDNFVIPVVTGLAVSSYERLCERW